MGAERLPEFQGPFQVAHRPLGVTSQEWRGGPQEQVAPEDSGTSREAARGPGTLRTCRPRWASCPGFRSPPTRSSRITVHLPRPHLSRAAKHEPCALPPPEG